MNEIQDYSSCPLEIFVEIFLLPCMYLVFSGASREDLKEQKYKGFACRFA
jgi:hypothetical protein